MPQSARPPPIVRHDAPRLRSSVVGTRSRGGGLRPGSSIDQAASGPGAATRADQLVRAALSVSSNIAEACGRGSIPEFRRFLQYARGSAQETLTQLRVAAALDLSQARAIHEIEGRVALVIKTLGRLIAHPPPDK